MSNQEDTRGRILAAARAMVIEQPFEALQMQDIAARAGIGRATLYRHYATREQIVAELTISWGVAFHERLQSARAQPRNPRRRVHWVFQAIVDEALTEPNLIRAFLICAVQGKAGDSAAFGAINQLMPGLLALALECSTQEIPVRAARLLQNQLLASLINLQRGEIDSALAIGDLKALADDLLFTAGRSADGGGG